MLVSVVKGWGWTVADADTDRLGAASRMACHLTREILVIAQRSPVQRVKTLAYKIGDAILHGDECPHPADRGLVELEGESVAYVGCANVGIVSDDDSFGYVTPPRRVFMVPKLQRRGRGKVMRRNLVHVVENRETGARGESPATVPGAPGPVAGRGDPLSDLSPKWEVQRCQV